MIIIIYLFIFSMEVSPVQQNKEKFRILCTERLVIWQNRKNFVYVGAEPHMIRRNEIWFRTFSTETCGVQWNGKRLRILTFSHSAELQMVSFISYKMVVSFIDSLQDSYTLQKTLDNEFHGLCEDFVWLKTRDNNCQTHPQNKSLLTFIIENKFGMVFDR